MCLALLLLVAALTPGCESRADRLRGRLAAFEAEALRLAWSCDAMGVGLGQYLDLHEAELRDDAQELARDIAALSDAEEQRQALDELAPPGNTEARAALAACGEHPGVQRALARSADMLAPLWGLDQR